MTESRAPRTYWDYDPADPVSCPRCPWSGVTGPDDTMSFLDVRCPACDGPILKLSWPSAEETRAAAVAGNERARRELRVVEERARRQEAAARVELRDPSQLPPVDGARIELLWDFVEVDGEHWTVLRHGDRELFRELAYWEGIERFKEVVAILRRAYGPRLRAVTPTPESEMYLYGDRLGAPRTVEGLNEGLRGGSAA